MLYKTQQNKNQHTKANQSSKEVDGPDHGFGSVRLSLVASRLSNNTHTELFTVITPKSVTIFTNSAFRFLCCRLTSSRDEVVLSTTDRFFPHSVVLLTSSYAFAISNVNQMVPILNYTGCTTSVTYPVTYWHVRNRRCIKIAPATRLYHSLLC